MNKNTQNKCLLAVGNMQEVDETKTKSELKSKLCHQNIRAESCGFPCVDLLFYLPNECLTLRAV